MRKCFFLLVSALWWMMVEPAIAQEPNYVHYGVNEGLPTSEVYQSIQDDRGYIWFGTDRGLVRFDGFEFKVFTMEDGLSSNVVFGFHRDHQARIWFYTYHGGIGYLEGDSIKTPSFNEDLKERLSGYLISSMYIDKNDTIWLGSRYLNGSYKIDPAGNIEMLPTSESMAFEYLTRIDSFGFVRGIIRSKGIPTASKENAFFYTWKGKKMLLKFPGEHVQNTNTGVTIRSRNGRIYCSQNTAVISIEDTTIKQSARLPGLVTLSLFEDSEGNIWSGLHRAGAVCYKQGNLTAKPSQFLKGRTVTSVFEDREGGMWFTTSASGIYYTPSIKFVSERFKIGEITESVTAIKASDSKLIVGTINGLAFEQDLQARSAKPATLLSDSFFAVYWIEETRNVSLIGSNWNFALDSNHVATSLGIVWADQHSDSVWALVSQTSPRINHPKITGTYLLMPEDSVHERYLNMERWKGRFYLGGSTKLLVRSGDAWENIVDTKIWVTDQCAGDDFLFIATKHAGLQIYDGHSLWGVDKTDGLPENRIIALQVENDSVVWVGTKQGIARVAIDHKSKRVSIYNMTISDGLISNEVRALSLHNGRLWVGTNEGISSFYTHRNLGSSTAPIVHLQQIKVNGEIHAPSANSEFNHTANIIDFQFAGVSFASLGKVNYKYRLVGYDQDWSQTSSHQVRYMLRPGSYTFEVMAQNHSGVWSQQPAVYSFEIIPPFWQRWWFITFCMLGLVAIVLGIAAYRTRQVRTKGKLELELSQSRLQGLTSQLNPHFLFNAMNSIHNYIRKNDRDNSTEYLIRFSSLMRQILDNSKHPLIPIGEELKLVERYLEVEQMRFKNRMTFEIITDPAIDAEAWKIPGQLIQPYVENAIWHGLLNKEGAGNVEVRLEMKNKYLECSIQDDGVGRLAASKFQHGTKEHKSTGMQLGRERLQLISTMLKQPATMEIIDLSDENGHASGTRVVLTLPIIQDE